ncbi:MAG: hypothetical protein DSZ31_05535 [Gammaproteobacteria bacterium]|nr:MAG: hypothetical protein DSZ31_05535 [Gammaproteobacteria bacterium]
MKGNLKSFLKFFQTLLGWLFTAYIVYLFFLYLWSTFEYIFPKASFVVSLLITAMVVGYLGWKYIPSGAKR